MIFKFCFKLNLFFIDLSNFLAFFNILISKTFHYWLFIPYLHLTIIWQQVLKSTSRWSKVGEINYLLKLIRWLVKNLCIHYRFNPSSPFDLFSFIPVYLYSFIQLKHFSFLIFETNFVKIMQQEQLHHPHLDFVFLILDILILTS